MKVIGQEAQRMHLPARLGARLTEGIEETLPVWVIQKNQFPAIPAIHHVVNRPGIFHSQRTGHRPTLATPNPCVNS
jgi:hypothetical protein